MMMITHPEDERFMHDPLVQAVMEMPKYRHLHDVLSRPALQELPR
jgi:hypothetical protein